MNNREKAEQIYNDLNIRGAGIGNASIGIIEKSLESIHETETTSKDFANVVSSFEQIFDTRTWTHKQHDAWHKNIPDISKAFKELKKVTFEDAQH